MGTVRDTMETTSNPINSRIDPPLTPVFNRISDNLNNWLTIITTVKNSRLAIRGQNSSFMTYR